MCTVQTQPVSALSKRLNINIHVQWYIHIHTMFLCVFVTIVITNVVNVSAHQINKCEYASDLERLIWCCDPHTSLPLQHGHIPSPTGPP